MKFSFLTLTLSFITLPLLYSMTQDEQYLIAACAQDIEQVREALAAGVNVNVQGWHNRTALHYAFDSSLLNTDLVKLLLGAGADINMKDGGGSTPLHQEVMRNHREIVKFLLDAGADIHAKDNQGRTPLDVSHPDLIPLLKDYIELLEQIQSKPTKKLLTQAIDLGYVHAVKLLLKAGIKPDLQDLVLVKQKYNQDRRSVYKESYAAIGRMLLQHVRLIGELKTPEHNAIAKFYHWIMSLFGPNNINATEHVYGPISKSGLGLPEDIAHTIASLTY